MVAEKLKDGKSSTPGYAFFIGLLFVGLKLASVIHWSWWLVLLPFYGGYALIVFLSLLIWALEALLARSEVK